MTRRAKVRHKRRYVSQNADNRHFCLAIQRQKFCYETKEKAERACKFASGKQRVYYCESCCAYHTTHMPKKFYEKSGFREKNERIYAHIEKTANTTINNEIDTTKSKLKKFRKERIEAEKAKLANEESTVQRYLGCHLIRQIQNDALFDTTTEDELAKIINLDNPDAKQAFEKTVASGVRVERHLLELYMLYRLEMAQNGLVYESLSDMMTGSFKELSSKQQKAISYFLLALYNAGVIYVEQNAAGQRVYFLRTILTAEDLENLPEDCARYFEVD